MQDAVSGQDLSKLLKFEGDAATLKDRMDASAAQFAAGLVREMWCIRSDGRLFQAEVTIRNIAPSRGTRMAAVVRDISERKRVERLKDEFVSTVNHELRTPLTSIAGSLGLLEGGAAGALPANAARLISIAHANCQRLIRLINDMLDVEKIESGKMRFDLAPQPLADILRRSLEAVSGYAQQLGVRVESFIEAPELSARADSDRLVQVVTNLLSNALKHSNAGGVVDLSATRIGRLARICVRDHGAGIPDEFRARIFTKFAQADSSDARQRGGTGLGLVIAKEIVDRHGGRLWFESELGRGASFFVDLPLLDDATGAEPNNPDASVLICEDDPSASAILREALAQDGFTSDVVYSMGQARDALSRPNRYRALLLDLILPDGDGVTLIRELRADPKTRGMPIIVVSARAEAGSAEPDAAALNVVDWMVKPIDMARLRHAVEVAVARAAASRPLILHVEDDHDILRVTASALGHCGEVVAAENLASARSLLGKRKPDLVILDLALADGSGLELLPDLGRPSGTMIPVLIFSAHDTDEDVAGRVAAVMTKSKTSLGDLAEMVKELLAAETTEAERKRA